MTKAISFSLQKKRQLFFERKNLLKRGDLTLHSLGKDADIICQARFFDNAALKIEGKLQFFSAGYPCVITSNDRLILIEGSDVLIRATLKVRTSLMVV